MNRWRKLLVLWLLCVTMPLQAMAALRTHCTPGTPSADGQTGYAAMQAMHHAMMGGDAAAMPIAHHHDDASSMATSASVDNHDASPGSLASHDSAGHASCSACAACVVCTALPPSAAIRLPGAEPSTAIPFLRTTAASAVVAVPERPPKTLTA